MVEAHQAVCSVGFGKSACVDPHPARASASIANAVSGVCHVPKFNLPGSVLIGGVPGQCVHTPRAVV